MRGAAGEKHRERCPAKRWAKPHEIAGAAIFLASPAASYVNGHALIADGGTIVGTGLSPPAWTDPAG